MKMVCPKTLISVAAILFLSLSSGFATDKKEYPTSPPAKIAKKWRIGYYEGGAYHNYPKTLKVIVEGLAELGWTEPVVIPPQENDKDSDKIWAWLSANVKSGYIEFAADAYYSSGWNKENREKNRQSVLKRLKNDRDIDLLIAMGTWAGQDLADNEHSVPVVVCSASDPIRSKIIKSTGDSGYDHVHAHVDPTRYVRQIEAFHDVFGFKKLGVAYLNTVAGRSYAALEDIRKLAGERNFEILECHTLLGENASAVKCAQELAAKIDAFYLTQQAAVNKNTLPKILDAMDANKIPVFSQAGPGEVRQGVLLSIATPDFRLKGKFHAEVMAKIINGAMPRDLSQIFELRAKIAFNKTTAKRIDLDDGLYRLILETSDEVYE